jgi:hypothetical protein
MNCLSSLSQMQPSSAASKHETDTAVVVHQQPQEKDSNVQTSPSECDSGSENPVESSNTLYFPLPGEQPSIYTVNTLMCK